MFKSILESAVAENVQSNLKWLFLPIRDLFQLMSDALMDHSHDW